MIMRGLNVRVEFEGDRLPRPIGILNTHMKSTLGDVEQPLDVACVKSAALICILCHRLCF
jgi:hypothetical protein